MSKDAKKKERKRLKREKKRALIHKRDSVSPYRRISELAGAAECWINTDWRTRGLATPIVVARKPGGGLGMATYMIDLWCAGLKDAWGRLDMTRDEIDDLIEKFNDRMDGTMARVDLAEVRQVVAGSLRFAKQNGFKLPRHYERWTGFCGDLGDWQHSADLTHFGADGKPGKLRWVAPLSDLRRRLTGSTAEEFLARPDVEFIAEVGGSEFDDEWDDEDEAEDEEEDLDLEDEGTTPDVPAMLAGVVGGLAERAEEAVVKWCSAKGKEPEAELGSSLRLMLSSLMARALAARIEGPTTAEKAKAVDIQVFERSQEARALVLSGLEASLRARIEAADAQVGEYIDDIGGAEKFFNALGDPSNTKEADELSSPP